ncbi:MAG TPA: nucleotidyl transferase AbiEii/AbiGii toxin family protein [Hanamia sp.]
MLHYETIDSATLELLKQLQSIQLFEQLRLVGGTALALQLGHRKSIDLDLFGNIDSDVLEINNVLSRLGDITQLRDSTNIHIYLVNGIKVDIVNYAYPWLSQILQFDELRIATYEDIAAMKIAAITGRGTKKDFIDLYFLLKEFGLDKMMNLYQRKYKDGSVFMALKSLVYFDDAEKDEMPNMLVNVDWREVKEAITIVHAGYVKGLRK